MGIFDKLFGKKEKVKIAKSAVLSIKKISKLTEDSVKVIFDVPDIEKLNYSFIPGQYLDLEVELDGQAFHRSYSICSDIKESLAIGVKKVEDGKVSTWLNEKAKEGDKINVAFPSGNFTLAKADGNYVAFAAGSGITPILSISKFFSRAHDSKLLLFYGNRNENSIMFKDELKDLDNVEVRHILSREEKEGYAHGRLNADTVRDMIKKDLDILKSRGFFLCGPEEMILNVSDVLKTFGVPEEKIHYELFTTPTLMKSKQTDSVAEFDGLSKVTVILDDEEEKFDLESNGATILDEAESYGIEAPFSCRGGVCCTCKAKVLKGAVKMEKNFTLTDSEIEEGYILTCQAHPNSEELTITYDE